jgi:phospholipid/cholesterol/gamma-HCH transport system permease protein
MRLLFRPVIHVLQEIGSIVWLLIYTVQEVMVRLARGRAPMRMSMFFAQTERAGVGSVPIVAMVSFFLGLTMALLTGYQLKPYGTERLVPGLIGISFTRELGPLLTGIMVAARIGAAYTAELGTMKVSDEVEALEAMGIGALRYLVSPRLLSVTLLLPSLFVVSSVAAIFGAALISRFSLNIPFSYFHELLLTSLYERDIISGILKSILFGLIIGLIACYKGLTVRGGAEGVGESTTSSVVVAITTVIGTDTLLNMIMFSGGPQ